MYENENYTGNNTANSGQSPYFDYTARSEAEFAQTADAEGRKAKKQKKQKKAGKGSGVLKKFVLSTALGLCFGLFAGLGFYAVKFGTGQLTQTNGGENVVTEVPENSFMIPYTGNTGTTTNNITYVADDVSDMVEEVMPAMVSIVNNYNTSMNLWGQTYNKPGMSSGSGIIVGRTDDELLVVTNNHVVENATSLKITFIDNNTAEAVVKGTDADMDLAVVAIPISNVSEETLSAIVIAKLGDSDNLKLGQPVVAIGNALGYGQSVTNGIISALNREMTTEDGSTGTYIQTNAAINHGNSGGALLNINGEVIGINAAKIDGSTVEGMGYAIPISSASPIIAELMERQTRTDKVPEEEMGYMGITMQAVTNDISEAYGMPQGVFVREVATDSAASAAGIRKGDIIVKFDGQRITSLTDMQNTMQFYRAGETAVVTIKRAEGGEYVAYDLEITLGKRPANR